MQEVVRKYRFREFINLMSKYTSPLNYSRSQRVDKKFCPETWDEALHSAKYGMKEQYKIEKIISNMSLLEHVKTKTFGMDETGLCVDIGAYLSTDRILGYINTVIGVFGAVFNIFVTIVISIYILLQRKDIKEFLKKLGKSMFDESAYTRLSKYFTTSNKILLDFIYCQIIDAIIIGILVSIALTIIGVKYSILLGFFIGLFNIIPYFGAIIAIAVAVLITVFTGGVQQALIMAVTVIILQQIDANIINPKILGDGLKISPILVIFAVTIGGEFFGVIGMFLSVPVIAILKLLIVDFIEIREKRTNRS